MAKAVPLNQTSGMARKKRLGRGWKVLIIVVAVLIVLWVASEIAIPLAADAYIKGKIKNKYPKAHDISVSVHAFPAIRLAFKQYSSLDVKVSGITLENVNFQTITLHSKKWPLGTFDATITSSEIIRFFSLTHSYVLQPELTLNQDSLQVSGRMNLGYTTATVTAVGKLVPKDGKLVYFQPDKVTVAGISIPSKGVNLVSQIMKDNPVFVVREDLPFTISAITARNGNLDIKGSVNLEQALHVKL